MIAAINKLWDDGGWLRRHIAIVSMTVVAGILTLAAAIAWLAAPHVEIRLAIADISADSGFAYTAPVSRRTPLGFIIVSDGDGVSNLQLRENGQSLGPAHASHSDIRENGKGRYSHWRGRLWFSASDSTDPRTNGRTYSISARASLHPLVLSAVVLFDFICFWIWRRKLRRRYPSKAVQAGSQWAGSGAAPIATCVVMTLVMLACAFAFAWLAHLEYRTNDDVGMRLIAEAVIGGPGQSEFLLFQNVLVGLFLRALYGLAPALPWYDLVLAAGTILGAFLCGVALMRLCRSRAEIAFCVILGITFFTPIFQAYQFTASAMLLGAGASLILASIVFLPTKTRLGLWVASAAILLAFLAGSLVRLQGTLLAASLILPVVMLFALFRFRRAMLIPILALTCGIVGSFLLQAYDNRYYKNSPGWESFREHGHQIARATDYAFADRSQQDAWQTALSAAQWTNNDYRLIAGWLFQNEELFSVERIKRFADLAPSSSIASRLDLLRERLVAPKSLAWVALIFVGAAVLIRRSRLGLACALLSVLSTMVVLAGITVFFKTNFEHILWPFYTVAVLAATVAILGQASRYQPRTGYLAIEGKLVEAIVLLGAVGLAVLQIGEVFSRGASSDDLRRRVDHDVAVWPVGPDSVVVVWDRNFPFETWVRPFHPTAPMLRRLLHVNAPSISPLVKPIYAGWGTSDVAWSMCHVPGVYRVDARLGYAPHHAQMLKTYMLEHHRENIEIVPVFAGEALSLYGCRVVAAESDRQK